MFDINDPCLLYYNLAKFDEEHCINMVDIAHQKMAQIQK